MLPVRCFSCNKLLGQYFCFIDKFDQQTFDRYHIKRFCCKKILLHSIDIHRELQQPKNTDVFSIKKEMETKRFIITD
jgi:DNA-directed RNA polymerase subunit N (RpoN/RPB10)